jgi:predicted AlkP superfamily pyrophosphatase or phosphodiesterase
MKALHLFLLLGGLALVQTQAQVKNIEHFIIIGCDGMSPDGVMHAKSPVMRRMMREGSYTMHGRGVMPTSSSPNWASMIMGAGPEQHGVTSNDWETNKFEISPIALGSGGMFPTIFGLLREQRPESVIACFHDWDGFGRLFERNAVNKIENPKGPTNTTENAIQYFMEKKPNFLFIHLDHVDHAGHSIGHGTREYYEAVDVADTLIGKVLDAVQKAGVSDSTLVLVTADHGGKGKSHGGATMGELEIPWILVGPGVKKSHELKKPLNTYDTALTVSYTFGLKPHPAWIGKPVLEAFEKNR